MSKVKSYKDLIPTTLLFYVAIRPRSAATTSRGGLALAEETQETEQFLNQVGEIVSRGALAYAAKTPGLDYALDPNVPQIGDWVAYQKNAGMRLNFLLDTDGPLNGDNKVSIILLSDTDVIAKLTKKQVEHLTGWSQ